MSFPSFTTGEVLTASDMNAVGMWLVRSQAITGTPTVINVTNVFSADYDAYKVVVTGVRNTATQAEIALQLNNATTAGYYGSFQFVNYATNVQSQASDTNNVYWRYVGSCGNPTGWLGGLVCDIINPFAVGFTSIIAGPSVFNQISGIYTGIQDANVSHTGFNLISPVGNMSGGNIRVYGYRN
jgi:hypothetical protein